MFFDNHCNSCTKSCCVKCRATEGCDQNRNKPHCCDRNDDYGCDNRSCEKQRQCCCRNNCCFFGMRCQMQRENTCGCQNHSHGDDGYSDRCNSHRNDCGCR